MLRCKDCGRAFLGKRIHNKSGERVIYICDTYHRYGKEYCTSHQIDEFDLDELMHRELLNTKEQYQASWTDLEQFIQQWQPKAETATAQITKQQEHIALLEEEVEAILMERIRDKANAERYDRMIQKREEEIAHTRKQIEQLKSISEVIRERQKKLRQDISLIDEILQDGVLSETHLRMLVEQIYVHDDNGKLSLDIHIKAPFQSHMDHYEGGLDGELLSTIIYGDVETKKVI